MGPESRAVHVQWQVPAVPAGTRAVTRGNPCAVQPASAACRAPFHRCLGRSLLQNLDISVDTNINAVCFLSCLINPFI